MWQDGGNKPVCHLVVHHLTCTCPWTQWAWKSRWSVQCLEPEWHQLALLILPPKMHVQTHIHVTINKLENNLQTIPSYEKNKQIKTPRKQTVENLKTWDKKHFFPKKMNDKQNCPEPK